MPHFLVVRLKHKRVFELMLDKLDEEAKDRILFSNDFPIILKKFVENFLVFFGKSLRFQFFVHWSLNRIKIHSGEDCHSRQIPDEHSIYRQFWCSNLCLLDPGIYLSRDGQ